MQAASAQLLVMPGLDPGIHVLRPYPKKGVDGRVKPGHDEADRPKDITK
jgi:hypothetical protein